MGSVCSQLDYLLSHIKGGEILDGLADPAFFQKVMTLASPGRKRNKNAHET